MTALLIAAGLLVGFALVALGWMLGRLAPASLMVRHGGVPLAIVAVRRRPWWGNQPIQAVDIADRVVRERAVPDHLALSDSVAHPLAERAVVDHPTDTRP